MFKFYNASGIPLRIGIASCLQFFGIFSGTFVYFFFSNPLKYSINAHISGYLYSYLVAFISSLLALLYLIFFLRESHNVQGFVLKIFKKAIKRMGPIFRKLFFFIFNNSFLI